MANHCYNFIQVRGSGMNEAHKIIKQALNDYPNGQGYLPEWIDLSKLSYAHYLFDIENVYKYESIFYFQCWTKWSPPMEELKMISQRIRDTRFEMEYEEGGVGIYGRCVIENGEVINQTELTEEEVDSVQYDEKKGVYVRHLPDGKTETYESDNVAFAEMLDEKSNF